MSEGGVVGVSGRRIRSRWWREIVNSGAGILGSWFVNNLERVIGGGGGLVSGLIFGLVVRL